MSIRYHCLALLAVLIAGCAEGRLPSNGLAEPSTLERAMKRFYEMHASEDRGQCRSPTSTG